MLSFELRTSTYGCALNRCLNGFLQPYAQPFTKHGKCRRNRCKTSEHKLTQINSQLRSPPVRPVLYGFKEAILYCQHAAYTARCLPGCCRHQREDRLPSASSTGPNAVRRVIRLRVQPPGSKLLKTACFGLIYITVLHSRYVDLLHGGGGGHRWRRICLTTSSSVGRTIFRE